MKLTVEISEECLSKDPVYCEDFETDFRCFFHMEREIHGVEVGFCDHYFEKLGYDDSGQSLKCEKCRNKSK